jgi:hypothetical protein
LASCHHQIISHHAIASKKKICESPDCRPKRQKDETTKHHVQQPHSQHSR